MQTPCMPLKDMGIAQIHIVIKKLNDRTKSKTRTTTLEHRQHPKGKDGCR
jgi:hypothetical protein